MSKDMEVTQQHDAPAKQNQPVASTRRQREVPLVITRALLKIQRKLEPIVREAKNAAYGTSYSPLEVVAPMAHKLLNEHNIAVVQNPTHLGDQPALETIFTHYNGDSFSRTTPLVLERRDPQGHKGAITYMSRTMLMRMIGITDVGEDDDGNQASGVQAPVTEEQLNEIKMLLLLMNWPKESVAKAVFALKTRDAADLAITKYRSLVSEKKRDEESKANAMKIEVGEGDEAGSVDPVVSDADPLSQDAIQARITTLGLKDKIMENKLVNRLVSRPTLAMVKTPEKMQELSDHLKHLESGAYALPAEFYPAATEPRTVSEDVA